MSDSVSRSHARNDGRVAGSSCKSAAFFVLTALLAVVGCGPSAPQTIPTLSANEDTTLGAGDKFSVVVFGEEELSSTFRVAHDGSIDFPLVGHLDVSGLEPPAVAELIRTRLHDGHILVNPFVSVSVDEYVSKRVTVMGVVARAGTFPMTTGLTVVQVISLAGGFSPLAARNDTVLTRTVNGERHRYGVPADDVSRGRAQDVPVQAGDIIFVPERAF